MSAISAACVKISTKTTAFGNANVRKIRKFTEHVQKCYEELESVTLERCNSRNPKSAAEACRSSGSQKMLIYVALISKFGVDTTENRPSKIWFALLPTHNPPLFSDPPLPGGLFCRWRSIRWQIEAYLYISHNLLIYYTTFRLIFELFTLNFFLLSQPGIFYE